MKILAIADTEERCLWEYFRKERFEGVDLILSAGDLDPDYLEYENSRRKTRKDGKTEGKLANLQNLQHLHTH